MSVGCWVVLDVAVERKILLLLEIKLILSRPQKEVPRMMWITAHEAFRCLPAVVVALAPIQPLTASQKILSLLKLISTTIP
jgi:hypothetical protein